jgi:beta-galactosidase GanA
MGFFEDAWNWTKNAAKDVYNTITPIVNTVKEVAPYITPLLALKKGKDGKMKEKEFKDTPKNRKIVLKAFNKHHKTKISLENFNKIIDSK